MLLHVLSLGAKRKTLNDEFLLESKAIASTYGFMNFSTEEKIASSGDVCIKVTVESDFTWTVLYKGVFCRKNLPVLHGLPDKLDMETLAFLFI